MESSAPYRKPATPESLASWKQTRGRSPEALAEDYRKTPEVVLGLMKDEKLMKGINGYTWPKDKERLDALAVRRGVGLEHIIAVLKFGPEFKKRKEAGERGSLN